MATWLKGNGSAREVLPIHRPTWTLDELHRMLGDLVELVPLRDGRWLAVNEREEQSGQASDLPHLFHQSCWRVIVHDAVVCAREEIERAWVDPPARLCNVLLETRERHLEAQAD